MKIYNKVILSWNEDKQQFDTVYEDSYDYYGDVDYFAPSDEDIKSEMRRKNENVGHSKLSIESSGKLNLLNKNSNSFIENCLGEFRNERSRHSIIALTASISLAPSAKLIGTKPPEEFHSLCLYLFKSIKISTKESESATFVGIKFAVEKIPISLNCLDVLSIIDLE